MSKIVRRRVKKENFYLFFMLINNKEGQKSVVNTRCCAYLFLF